MHKMRTCNMHMLLCMCTCTCPVNLMAVKNTAGGTDEWALLCTHIRHIYAHEQA